MIVRKAARTFQEHIPSSNIMYRLGALRTPPKGKNIQVAPRCRSDDTCRRRPDEKPFCSNRRNVVIMDKEARS